RRGLPAWSVAVGRTEWEEWTIWPRLVDRPCKGRPCEQPSPIGMDTRECLADRVGPVSVKQRRCGSAVGEGEGVTRRPLASRHCVVEPAVGGMEHLPCFGDTLAVAMLCCADAVGHDPLHRCHDVVVEEAVHHAHVECGTRILGDQPHWPGMMETEMLDDDARFHHRAALVHEHGNTLERPQGLVLSRRALVARCE